MELEAIKALFRTFHGGYRGGICVGGPPESFRHPGDIIGVAHPADPLLGQAPEKYAVAVIKGLGLAILLGLGGGDLPAQGVGHGLDAVADPQHRHPLAENLRVDAGGVWEIDTVGPTGENHANGPQLRQLLQSPVIGVYLAVYPQLPHPAGDKLVVLAAKIQNQHGLMCCHTITPIFRKIPPSFCHGAGGIARGWRGFPVEISLLWDSLPAIEKILCDGQLFSS